MASLERSEFILINELIINGHYEEAFSSLELAKKSDKKLTSKEKLQSELLLSRILLNQGNYSKSAKIAQSVYKRSLKNDCALSMEAINIIIKSFHYQDDFQKIIYWKNNGEEIYNQIDKLEINYCKPLQASFIMNKGMYLYKIGEFEEARIHLHQALILIENHPSESLKAEILENIAYLYLKQGNVDLAIENYQESLNLWEAIGNHFSIARVKNELASILALQGDIHLANAILQQELEIVMRNSDKNILASYQFNIGLIYLELNEVTEALEWLKLSLGNFKVCGNKRKIAEILYYYILIYTNNNSPTKASTFLEQLTMLVNKTDDLLVYQWWLLGKALTINKSKRYSDLSKIEEIYNEIIGGKELDIKITTIAMLNLCELQLNYLLTTEDPDLLFELEKNLIRLEAFASLQDSYILFIKTYLLHAQVAILLENIQQTYDLLNQARSFTQIKELQRLADEISNFNDTLNTKLELWEKLYRTNASLIDLLDLSHYEKKLKNIARERVTQRLLQQDEDPILILIQDPGGTSMFSKKFLPNSEFDEQLISAFLFAINNFMQETFAGKGTIDRITYLDYTILFKPKEPFLICYAYRGQSYTAQQNLDLFTERFGHSLSIWQSLINYTLTGLVPELDALMVLESLVDDIFAPIRIINQPNTFDDDSLKDHLNELLDSKL